jgi:hypothetical protein
MFSTISVEITSRAWFKMNGVNLAEQAAPFIFHLLRTLSTRSSKTDFHLLLKKGTKIRLTDCSIQKASMFKEGQSLQSKDCCTFHFTRKGDGIINHYRIVQ